MGALGGGRGGAGLRASSPASLARGPARARPRPPSPRLTLTALWAASLLPATTVRGPPMPQKLRRWKGLETGTVETAKS